MIVPNLTMEDAEVMAQTLWAEARGEPVEGILAVGNVIINRYRDDRWPETITKICRQPHQFSCWNGASPVCGRVGPTDLALCKCLAFTWAMLAGRYLHDYSGGANHYLNPAAVDSMPSWYDPAKITAEIGHHVFLKL